MSFPNFFGNAAVARALARMVEQDRIPQTMLLAGPEGVGKATLARRFAAALLGDAEKIETDDLSLRPNLEILAEREKWSSERRADEPLFFATHPDFVTFCPDGPLRQISIQQMRLLRERAQFAPRKGSYRVFLIDQLDRANDQAANSLLKILEEPPSHLVLLATAQNAYDLLPTIRSRAVIFLLSPLSPEQMLAFARSRGWSETDRRLAFAGGSPGLAVTLDVEQWELQRKRMLSLLKVASGQARFASWVKHAEAVAESKSEKLEPYLKILYALLEDVLLVKEGRRAVRNPDLQAELERLAAAVSREWLLAAVRRVDEMAEFARRNIQKGAALDSFAVELRAQAGEA
ncbi:MAG: AAA family ATPase [Bryobacteraceae bacterium]|nr:AAA family ATPase [Bryobacteraceae bacterium]MDW8380385.1 AAA family ATPase [Bryobacterales bacterium]